MISAWAIFEMCNLQIKEEKLPALSCNPYLHLDSCQPKDDDMVTRWPKFRSVGVERLAGIIWLPEWQMEKNGKNKLCSHQFHQMSATSLKCVSVFLDNTDPTMLSTRFTLTTVSSGFTGFSGDNLKKVGLTLLPHRFSQPGAWIWGQLTSKLAYVQRLLVQYLEPCKPKADGAVNF